MTAEQRYKVWRYIVRKRGLKVGDEFNPKLPGFVRDDELTDAFLNRTSDRLGCMPGRISLGVAGCYMRSRTITYG